MIEKKKPRPHLKVKPKSSVDVEVYFSNAQHARARLRLLLFVMGCVSAVIFIFIGFVLFVTRVPLFRLASVTVSGNRFVSAESVQDLASAAILRSSWSHRVLGAENLTTWPKELSADMLRALPTLKSVTVEKSYYRHSVLMNVQERQPMGIWCKDATTIEVSAVASTSVPENASTTQPVSDEATAPSVTQCWWYDSGGVLFRRAPSAQGSLIPVVHDYSRSDLGLFKTVLPDALFANLLSVFDALSRAQVAAASVKLINIDFQELEVDTYSGLKFYFSLRFPADATAQVIDTLRQDNSFGRLQYVDFRVENRVYYK